MPDYNQSLKLQMISLDEIPPLQLLIEFVVPQLMNPIFSTRPLKYLPEDAVHWKFHRPEEQSQILQKLSVLTLLLICRSPERKIVPFLYQINLRLLPNVQE